MFHAYMLRCADGSYYVGHTDDLDAQLIAHARGRVSSYTATRRPLQLVWSEPFEARDDAFARARQLKGWSRAKKEALIAGDFERLRMLARPPRERVPTPPGLAAPDGAAGQSASPAHPERSRRAGPELA